MKNSLKIAFIVPYRFVPPRNGGHQAAYGLAAFAAKASDFFVLSTDANPLEGEQPFALYRHLPEGKRKYFSPAVARRVGKFLRKQEVDVCLLHQPFIGLLLGPVLRKLKIPMQVWVQNLEYERFRSMGKWYWPIVKRVEGRVYRRADKLFFISPDEIAPAIEAFQLEPGRCMELPYGCYPEQSPPPERAAAARKAVLARHGFSEEEKLLLFFGPQTYRPNLEAVEHILLRINPFLKERAEFPYRILICGGGLPDAFRQMEAFSEAHIAYLGYVEDIEEYVLASDLVLNPVVSGGGVKTKLIEALALGKSVVSYRQGALGVHRELCGKKLGVVPDHAHELFCEKLFEMLPEAGLPVPGAFYEHYQWAKVAQRFIRAQSPE